MKPTLLFFFLATLSSLVFSLPLQPRQFDKLQASQAKLGEDIAKFTHIVSTLDIEVDIYISLGPILRDIIGDYQDCDSALQKNGKLSDSQARDVDSQYRSSSSNFSNALNQVAATRRNSPFARVTAAVGGLRGNLVSATVNFGNRVHSANTNGANQKEIDNTNDTLQNAIQQAFN